MPKLEVNITPKLDGMRLDLALVAADLGLSRRKIRSIIDIGGAYVNGKRLRIASRTVAAGDKVRLEYNDQALRTLRAAEFKFTEKEILYLDHHTVAVNKPPGLPSQPTRDQAVMHVGSVLKDYFKDELGRSAELTAVHRLDKETTGVMLMALKNVAATWLMEQFKTREVHKLYHAICYGIPEKAEFEVRSYLSEINKKTGMVQTVRSGGRLAETGFRVIASSPALGLSLIACAPITGRSHQLRVQLDSVGHPIVGDKRYGSERRRPLPETLEELAGAHHFLHAQSLTFRPAKGLDPITLEATYPENFAAFLKAFR